VVRAKLDIRTDLVTAINELRVEIDSRIALCRLYADLAKSTTIKVDNRIKKFEDSVADINTEIEFLQNDRASWYPAARASDRQNVLLSEMFTKSKTV